MRVNGPALRPALRCGPGGRPGEPRFPGPGRDHPAGHLDPDPDGIRRSARTGDRHRLRSGTGVGEGLRPRLAGSAGPDERGLHLPDCVPLEAVHRDIGDARAGRRKASLGRSGHRAPAVVRHPEPASGGAAGHRPPPADPHRGAAARVHPPRLDRLRVPGGGDPAGKRSRIRRPPTPRRPSGSTRTSGSPSPAWWPRPPPAIPSPAS